MQSNIYQCAPEVLKCQSAGRYTKHHRRETMQCDKFFSSNASVFLRFLKGKEITAWSQGHNNKNESLSMVTLEKQQIVCDRFLEVSARGESVLPLFLSEEAGH